MRARLLVAALLAALPVVATAAPQGPKVLITSSSKTDAPAKANEASSGAAFWARMMEVFTAETLAGAYPCSSQMTPSDVGALLDHERKRQLLGSGGDPATMASIAGSIGARYLVNVMVTQYGGKSTISIMLMDTNTARAVARDITTIPVDSDAADALEAFAKKFVSGLAGTFPKCPGPWKGTVTITTATKEHGVKPGEGPWDSESALSVTCTVDQPQGDATCKVGYKFSMTGNGAFLKSEASGSVTAYAMADVSPSAASVSVSPVRVEGTLTTNLGGGPYSFDFGPWSAKAASTGDANHSSGSWSDGKGTTISWSFSRQ